MWRRFLLVVAVLSTVGAVLVPSSGADQLSEWRHWPPDVLPTSSGDFPDPSILVEEDGYWAYSTGSAGRNLQVMSSTDLQQWSDPTDPLPVLPAWGELGHTWAPSVARIDERFVMYYTLRHRGSGRQCISAATADTAGGPFRDDRDEPLVCQLDRLGSIDPAIFVEDGTAYLLWKSDDNAGGQPTNLWAQPLTDDGLELVGDPTQLLGQAQPWQRGIIEGPAMLKTDRGHLLFYGAGEWWTASAGIGYATCDSPLGPCTDRSKAGPWLGAQNGPLGPAGPAPFVDRDGVTRLAYHAWTRAVGYDHGGARSLFVETLSIDRLGGPVLDCRTPDRATCPTSVV